MATAERMLKDKLKEVREFVPNVSNDNIILALEYYQYDTEQTVAAFLENGASEALQQWQHLGQKSSVQKNKKKKKSKKPSSGNDTEELSTTPSVNHVIESNAATSQAKANKSPDLQDADVGKVMPLSEGESVSHQQKLKDTNRSKEDYKQMTKKERVRTLSEVSNPSTVDRPSKTPHAGLEKSCKDLQRQSTSIGRLKVVLNEQMDKSYKRVTEVFKELHNQLNEREAELIFQLDKVKNQSNEILVEYELKAITLKQRTDRAQAMNKRDVAILRSDVKQFVGEKKYHEDLAGGQKFTCDFNSMLENIQKFGEAIPVKLSDELRRNSVVSIGSNHGVESYQTSPTANDLSKTSAILTSSSVSSALTSSTVPSTVKSSTVKSAVMNDLQHSSAAQPILSSSHILTQSESLTKYEASAIHERLASLSINDTAHESMQTSPAKFARSDRGRGTRGRGSSSARGRDNNPQQGQGRGQQSHGQEQQSQGYGQRGQGRGQRGQGHRPQGQGQDHGQSEPQHTEGDQSRPARGKPRPERGGGRQNISINNDHDGDHERDTKDVKSPASPRKSPASLRKSPASPRKPVPVKEESEPVIVNGGKADQLSNGLETNGSKEKVVDVSNSAPTVDQSGALEQRGSRNNKFSNKAKGVESG